MNNKDEYNKPGLVTFCFGLGISLIYIIWLSFFHPGIPKNVIKKGTVIEVKVEE